MQEYPPYKEGIIHFLHINTEGFCSKKRFVEFKLLLNSILLTQVNIYGVNEINLDTSKATIKRELFDMGQTVQKYGIQMFSTSMESYPRAFKPGGGYARISTTYCLEKIGPWHR